MRGFTVARSLSHVTNASTAAPKGVFLTEVSQWRTTTSKCRMAGSPASLMSSGSIGQPDPADPQATLANPHLLHDNGAIIFVAEHIPYSTAGSSCSLTSSGIGIHHTRKLLATVKPLMASQIALCWATERTHHTRKASPLFFFSFNYS